MHNVRRVKRSAEQEQARKEAEARKIDTYRKLEAWQQSLRKQGEFTEKALHSNTQILTANPENYSMWNFRREILKALGQPALLQRELVWMVDLIQRFPKNYWLWNHRRYILGQLNDAKVWGKELGLVNMLLERDGRNFHGWHYRRRVIKQLEHLTGESWLNDELDYTKEKINHNFSNYSAYHNRTLLLEAFEPSQERFSEELQYAKNAVLMDPQDQSAWSYYKWIITSKHWKQFQSTEVYRDELAEMSSLLVEEPDCLQVVLAVWQLSKLNGAESTDLKRKLAQMDPKRAKRYT